MNLGTQHTRTSAQHRSVPYIETKHDKNSATHGAFQNEAQRLLAHYSDNPSAFLAMNKDTHCFTSPNTVGMIAYRPAGKFLFQLGGVSAPEPEQRLLFDEFRAFAQTQNRKICALQLQPHDTALFRDAGFRINQIGRSYGVTLDGFTTRGKAFMKLRNKIKRARRAGVEIVELSANSNQRTEHWDALHHITQAWLSTKGAKLLEFMVGELGEPSDHTRRIFLAKQEGRPIAYVSYTPVYGRYPGWMHDLSRRLPNVPPGVMELINITALDRFRDEGARHLHFGFTPFAGVEPEYDNIEGRSPMVSWLVRQLAAHGNAIYPAQSQVNYKLKWKPDIIVPEYIAFEGRFRLGCLWNLLRLTKSL